MENLKSYKELEELFSALDKNIKEIHKSSQEYIEAVGKSDTTKKQLLILHRYSKYVEHKTFEMQVAIEEYTIGRTTKFNEAIKDMKEQEEDPFNKSLNSYTVSSKMNDMKDDAPF